MATQGALALSLFGSAELRGADSRAAQRLLAKPKIVALLAYLAVPSVGRFVRRDTLVGILWPELDQAHARSALRKAVHAVRRVLGAGVIVGRGDEEIALDAMVLGCDVAAFTAAADSGALARALELYRDELMPGFHLPECWEFDRWLDEQRVAARERVSAAAWAMAQLHERQREHTRAAELARKSVRYSWSDERALRRALLMLDRLGDRASALRLYEEFARRLAAELEAEPSAETLALVSGLRSAAPRGTSSA